jgi:hypothetical protein
MAKVIKPIKKEWNKIREDKNAPMELIQKENGTGVVRAKRLNPKRRSKGSGLKN